MTPEKRVSRSGTMELPAHEQAVVNEFASVIRGTGLTGWLCLHGWRVWPLSSQPVRSPRARTNSRWHWPVA